MNNRNLLADRALRRIPTLLSLLDRNPHSPTYGCFDKTYWHYRTSDFPSGIVQVFALALALARTMRVSGNPYFESKALRNWATAAVYFTAKTSHPDGSCDDYFPFERAGGATAFSLYGCLHTYEILDLRDSNLTAFFKRRTDWLAHHYESGQLSNHQAWILVCLSDASRILNTSQWSEAIEARLETLLSWQHQEGWFQEYDGCDPGYHSMTISLLAAYYTNTQDPRIKSALTRAVNFASAVINPDGSTGGPIGSRNTACFFPHGFELIGRWLPEARNISAQYLEGLANNTIPANDDAHLIGHEVINQMLAWRDWNPNRAEPMSAKPNRQYFPGAGLLIDVERGQALHVALKKGGVFQYYHERALVSADTQVSLRTKDGRTAIAHMMGDYDVKISENEIVVSGDFAWAKQALMRTSYLIIMRLMMLSLGRFFPNLVRALLQRLLITGRTNAPFSFIRTFHREPTGWRITDEISAENWHMVSQAGIGPSQTSIFVAMSRTFLTADLIDWIDLTEQIKHLESGSPLIYEHYL